MTDPDRVGPDGDARSFRFDLAGALERVTPVGAGAEADPVTESSVTPADGQVDQPPERPRRRWWRR